MSCQKRLCKYGGRGYSQRIDEQHHVDERLVPRHCREDADRRIRYGVCSLRIRTQVVNGYVYPITELAKGTSFMSGQGEPLSPEYQAWLGTWTVTSTSAEVTNAPVTFDVTFSKKVANSTYSVAGWGSSVYRLQYPRYRGL